MNEKFKPMLKVEELISHMKNKNIKFNYYSEDKAENYLRCNNNYYNLYSYNSLFERYIGGENNNKFIDLDFAFLKDLSIIDMRLRFLLFQLTINIEHYLKIEILNLLENIPEENGYDIVNEYLLEDFNDRKAVHSSIFKKLGDSLYRELFERYNINKNELIKDIPIWEFLEIITFGELIGFYIKFTKKYALNKQYKRRFVLIEINKLRNAVAHNSCILSDFNKKDNLNRYDYRIAAMLGKCGISESSRESKLINTRIRQITYTLFMFNDIVTSEGIKKYITKELNDLFYGRIIYHKEYYNNNELLNSIYEYFDKIIKKYYSMSE